MRLTLRKPPGNAQKRAAEQHRQHRQQQAKDKPAGHCKAPAQGKAATNPLPLKEGGPCVHCGVTGILTYTLAVFCLLGDVTGTLF